MSLHCVCIFMMYVICSRPTIFYISLVCTWLCAVWLQASYTTAPITYIHVIHTHPRWDVIDISYICTCMHIYIYGFTYHSHTNIHWFPYLHAPILLICVYEWYSCCELQYMQSAGVKVRIVLVPWDSRLLILWSLVAQKCGSWEVQRACNATHIIYKMESQWGHSHQPAVDQVYKNSTYVQVHNEFTWDCSLKGVCAHVIRLHSRNLQSHVMLLDIVPISLLVLSVTVSTPSLVVLKVQLMSDNMRSLTDIYWGRTVSFYCHSLSVRSVHITVKNCGEWFEPSNVCIQHKCMYDKVSKGQCISLFDDHFTGGGSKNIWWGKNIIRATTHCITWCQVSVWILAC